MTGLGLQGSELGDALQRELLEEAGVEIRIEEQIGLIHFRHTTPKPQGYPYPYPDFLWPAYVASAVRERPDAKGDDDYEIASEFMPLQEVRKLDLGDHEKALLEAAVSADSRDVDEEC